jgi:hypothetical protein
MELKTRVKKVPLSVKSDNMSGILKGRKVVNLCMVLELFIVEALKIYRNGIKKKDD